MILGFDTSTSDTAVAVIDGSKTVRESAVGPDPGVDPPMGGFCLVWLRPPCARPGAGGRSG